MRCGICLCMVSSSAPCSAIRQAAAAAGDTVGTTVIGTDGYTAPEQFRGAGQPASDLYALAGTLLFLLSGAAHTDDSMPDSSMCSSTSVRRARADHDGSCHAQSSSYV